MSASKTFRIVHAIAQLRFGAGRYVVDTAVAQHRREPGRVAVVLSEDVEAPWQSAPVLVDELLRAGVAVYRCGDFFRRSQNGLKAAANTLREAIVGNTGEWPDDTVVHAHTAMAAAIGRWAGASRVVLTCHGWGPGRPAEFDVQDALAYSLCDAVSSPSAHWAAVIREKTACGAVSVVPYGFNLDRLAKRERGHRQGGLRIVSVGELSHRKGPDLLVEAMPLVWARIPDAELHFIGDGELTGELREQARALDEVGTRVTFHGQVDDPVSRLGDFDVFALASRSDNQPVAIIEAMAAGLPIASTRVGGIAELIEGARCGFVVPADNVYELGLALTTLLETSTAGRRELGAAGSHFIREHFDIAAHLELLERLYHQGLAGAVLATSATPIVCAEPIRLHIGCNKEHRRGWVNIDARAEAEPDLVTRAHELQMFGDGSVTTIEACHLFEHLPLHEARAALAEWARVLRPGGELLLEMPDFDACVRLLGASQDAHGYDIAMLGIYGWPPGVEAYGDALVHRWGWSPQSLSASLRAFGFEEVEQVPLTQTWRPSAHLGADFRVRAIRATQSAEAAA